MRTNAAARPGRCGILLLALHVSYRLKCALGLVLPVSRAAVAFVPPASGSILSVVSGSAQNLPTFMNEGASHLLLAGDAASSSSSEGGGGVLGIAYGVLAAAVLVAIAIFATAKVTLRPQLAEGAEELRREDQTRDVLSLVKEQRNGGRDMGELVGPLEKVLGTSIAGYVASVDDKKPDATNTEKELAALLRTVYLSDQ